MNKSSGSVAGYDGYDVRIKFCDKIMVKRGVEEEETKIIPCTDGAITRTIATIQI